MDILARQQDDIDSNETHNVDSLDKPIRTVCQVSPLGHANLGATVLGLLPRSQFTIHIDLVKQMAWAVDTAGNACNGSDGAVGFDDVVEPRIYTDWACKG